MRRSDACEELPTSTASPTIISVRNGVSYSCHPPTHRAAGHGETEDVVEITDLSLQPGSFEMKQTAFGKLRFLALDVDIRGQRRIRTPATPSPSILRKHQQRLGSEGRHVTYSEEATQLRAHARRGSIPAAMSPPSEEDSPPKMSRSAARKSRFTDAFLEAKERLDEELNLEAADAAVPGTSNMKRFKVVLSSDTVNLPTGIEVSVTCGRPKSWAVRCEFAGVSSA